MTRMLSMLALAAGLSGCGHQKDVLGKDAFVQVTRDCHATGYSYHAATVKDGAPELSVVDATVQIDEKPVGVGRCVAERIAKYRYGHLQLEATPASIRE